MEKIITACLTIIGGVIVYSLTRLIEKRYLDPINDLNKLRGEVAHKIIMHANKFGNPDVFDEKIMYEASDEIRMLSAELRSKCYLLNNYRFLSFIRMVLPKKNILNASTALMGLSNGMYHKDYEGIEKLRNTIDENLRIET
jgi:hypothetical protein